MPKALMKKSKKANLFFCTGMGELLRELAKIQGRFLSTKASSCKTKLFLTVWLKLLSLLRCKWS